MSRVILSINECKSRASKFAHDWETASWEKQEAQTFWNEFFVIFGMKRRDVAIFEKSVEKLNNKQGFIDLFWPKTLLIEHKSAGLDLSKAMDQAKEYFIGLEVEEHPQYILACDFQNFKLVDLENHVRKEYNFKLSQLPENINCFDFMRGVPQVKIYDEVPVSIEASEMMGKIYDNLKKSRYPAHDIELLLTRLIYCLFADDTGIFDPQHVLYKYIKDRTSEDGSDLGAKLIELFQVLNTPVLSRQNVLDVDLAKFPYINGGLFEKIITIPACDSEIRNLLIEASDFDWSRVSPAIFGSLFQSVMDPNERRKGGSHYTSEANIMKVINPLFLDDLYDKFEMIKNKKDKYRMRELEKFQTELSKLKFLDPACGAGNFLIITYREIRRLELEIINVIHDKKVQLLDVSILSKVYVNQFYGIEINEFSAKIAETALWMMDHMMNMELSEDYGLAYARIPLEKHPNIVIADALDMDWNEIIPSDECSFVFGNPPFVGANRRNSHQKKQIGLLAGNVSGVLDYVCGWFLKAGEYVNKVTRIGFVATNSITRGQQVKPLWQILFDKYKIKINFAYEEFKWKSDAPDAAGVAVVILGLSKNNDKIKKLYDEGGKIKYCGEKHISPYLIVSNKQLPLVEESNTPHKGLPKMDNGSQPIDGGKYIFTDDQKKDFILKEPDAESLFKPFIGAKELLNRKIRWILDLHDIEPNELKKLPKILERMELVRTYRLASLRPNTKDLARYPTKWGVTTIPDKPFMAIPETTSEIREYIPIGYLEPPVIPSNKIFIIQDASIGLFGLLTSKMHMIWNQVIGGKLESRLAYSAGMVYNTFPFPEKKLDGLEPFAKRILDIREKHKGSTLVDLYNRTTMPPDLKKAHISLDCTVEKLYCSEPFKSDLQRIEFLLLKYEKDQS